MKNKDEIKKFNFNKKVLLIILVVVIVILAIFLLTRKGENGGSIIFDKDDTLAIGEKKYLQFLWLVDGAFNNERYKEEFTINNRKMSDSNKKFTCSYGESKKKCVASNFEEEFKDLFSSKITYNKVYGDGQAFYWYEKLDNKFYFTNVNSCNASRMNTKQEMKLKEETSDKIVYTISFSDDVKSGIYKGENKFERNFVLVKEDGKWKVSEAYYHDPCYMDYYIE